jgi:hypothetical protein
MLLSAQKRQRAHSHSAILSLMIQRCCRFASGPCGGAAALQRERENLVVQFTGYPLQFWLPFSSNMVQFTEEVSG